MRTLLTYLLLMLLVGWSVEAVSKEHYKTKAHVDSLKLRLDTLPISEEKIELLNHLAGDLARKDPREAARFATMAIHLIDSIYSEFIHQVQSGDIQAIDDSLKYFFDNELADAHFHLGNIHDRLGELPEALVEFQIAIEIKKRLNRQKELASCYNNIAMTCGKLGDFGAALEMFFEALTLNESLQLQGNIASNHSNIATVYFMKGDDSLSLLYNKIALKERAALGEERQMAGPYNNVGNIFYRADQLDSAIAYYELALPIYKKYDFKIGEAGIYGNLGSLYTDLRQFNKGLKYLKEALVLQQKLESKVDELGSILSLADHFKKREDYGEALKFYNKAVELSVQLGVKLELSMSYEGIALCYEQLGQYKLAVNIYKMYKVARDSLVSEESEERIQEMQTKYDTKTKEAEIQLLKEQKGVSQAQIAEQIAASEMHDVQRKGFMACSILFIAISLVGFKGYRDQKKAGGLLQQKTAVIEDKTKRIISSITYARRIQVSILPLVEDFQKIFPDSFIMLKPRDIVSGDFYWFVKQKDVVTMCVVDCTGHGVPGAFMSLIGNECLKEIVIGRKITDPAAVLLELHKSILLHMKIENSLSLTADGMDLVVCTLNVNSNQLLFSSTGRPLFVVTKGELSSKKGGQFPLGIVTHVERSYQTKMYELQKGDSFYLFSDGFADQYGGPNYEKITRSGFQEVLKKIAIDDMVTQQAKLEQYFENWKGDKDQIDDVCVMGIRI